MEIDLFIDCVTPCLIERVSGKVIATDFRKIERKEVRNLTKGWNFNWLYPFREAYDVYGLSLENAEIQGLISMKPIHDEKFMQVGLVENAPHNVGANGIYSGVGAHLFAIAAKLSFEMGFDGYTFFIAKSGLIEHYKKTLSALQIGNTHQMYLDTFAAQILVKAYFDKESL